MIKRKKNGKTGLIILSILLILIILLIIFTGFFVVKPIAASNINQKSTFWFIRIGTGLPFISSPESLAIKKFKKANILGSTAMLIQTLTKIKNKKIAKLPYIGLLYKLSLVLK